MFDVLGATQRTQLALGQKSGPKFLDTYVLTNELRNNKLIICKIGNQVLNVLTIEDHTKPYIKYENYNTSKNV